MTPIGDHHVSCLNRLVTLFAPLAAREATLSVQNPLVLDRHKEPQPDLALLRYRADGYQAKRPHADDCLLVIEVGDTSAESDRQTKIPLYAQAGIREAWLVDLPEDRIEVYRRPTGGRYPPAATVLRGDTLAPVAFPNLSLNVQQILG